MIDELARAQRDGLIQRPTHCSVCRHRGTERNPIQMADLDVASPRQVTWLCRRCKTKRRAADPAAYVSA